MGNSVEGKYADNDTSLFSLENDSAFSIGNPGNVASAQNKHLPLLVNTLRIADFAFLLSGGYLGFFIHFGFHESIPDDNHLVIYLAVIITVLSLHMARSYDRRIIGSLPGQLTSLLAGAGGAVALLFLCGFLSGILGNMLSLWMLYSILVSASLLLLSRVTLHYHVCRLAKQNKVNQSIVIFGVNEQTAKVIDALMRKGNSKVSVLGIFDDRAKLRETNTKLVRPLGTFPDLLAYIREHHVDRILVTLPIVSSDRITGLLKKLSTVPVRIDLVPNEMIWQFPRVEVAQFDAFPVLTVANRLVHAQQGLLKRIEDIFLASVIIICFFPLMLLIACAIKLDSRGPIFFKQKRHGYNNKIFEIYKFRSMKVEPVPEKEVRQASKDDLRVTRIGKYLRRYSLDELPQFFNVLVGNMSVVGPRPHALQHNAYYESMIVEYFARHNVKPGITGWAQVNGLRGETIEPEKMCRRVNYDIHYIENWTIWLDFKIILMTAVTVWFHDTAY